MTPVTFEKQMKRLITRFSERAIDSEFSALAWRECRTMSDESFIKFVDVMIGSRTIHKPPLIAEFREARLTEERNKLRSDSIAASQAMSRVAPEGLKKHLDEEFPGCSSLMDAVEKKRRQMRSRDDGPDGAA